MKICLFLPNWLGDLVMATPALRALRRRFGPSARIVGILRPHLADLLAGVSWLDEQWYYDPRAKQSQWHSWALVQRMRRERFDMAVLLTNSFRTAALAWLGGAKERIGYVRDDAGAPARFIHAGINTESKPSRWSTIASGSPRRPARRNHPDSN